MLHSHLPVKNFMTKRYPEYYRIEREANEKWEHRVQTNDRDTRSRATYGKQAGEHVI